MKKGIIPVSVILGLASAGAMATVFVDSTFSVDNGELVERIGDGHEIRYTRSDALAASCANKLVAPIKERFSKQPSSDIQGIWRHNDLDDKDSQAFLVIRATGQVDTYKVFDGECYGDLFGETEGNRLYQEPIEPFIPEKTGVVLAPYGDKLVWTDILTFGADSQPASMILGKREQQALPSACDLSAALPDRESHDNNPVAAVVGIWEMARPEVLPVDELVITEFVGNDVPLITPLPVDVVVNNEMYVVTEAGYLASVSSGESSCEVNYIGELDGSSYIKAK